MKPNANAPTLQNSNSNTVYLSLGSNLGDRNAILDQAERMLGERGGKIIAKSQRLENDAVGFVSFNRFVNEVLAIETALAPLDMLHLTQDIERALGRSTKSLDGTYKDRTIDIDIIYYEDQIISTPELTVPHPRMHERLFVLLPLLDIAPEIVHPVLHKTTKDLLFCATGSRV